MTSLKDKFWVLYIAKKLDERFGRIAGVTRLEKIIFFCRKRLQGRSECLHSVEFERAFYGPRDPGGSYDLETNLMLGIFEKEEKKSLIQLRVTEKGNRVPRGIEAILGLEPNYEESKKEIDEEIETSGKKSLSQILQDKRVKEAKKKLFKEKV